MNDRQQRAQASIMAIISALPWTERRGVVKAVILNDEICVQCGRVTEVYGDCKCQDDAPIDGTGWAEAAFESHEEALRRCGYVLKDGTWSKGYDGLVTDVMREHGE